MARGRSGGRSSPQPPPELVAALQAHQRGDLDAAERGYRSVLEGDAGQPDALNLLGALLLARGTPEQAVSLARRAVAALPGQPAFHNNLGEALRALGDLAGAEQAYRKAVRLAPDFVQAWCNLAAAQLAGGRLAQAADSASRASRLRPGSPEVLVSQARVALASGNFNAAAKYFRAVLEKAPAHLQSMHALVQALAGSGLAGEAAEVARQLCEKAPGEAQAWWLLAENLRQADDAEGAEAAARRAVELAPGVLEPLLSLEAAVRAQGRLEESVRLLREALLIEPARAATHNNLGTSLIALGELEEARRCFERALEIEPGMARAWENLVRLPAPGAAEAQRLAARLEAHIGNGEDDSPQALSHRAGLHFAMAGLRAAAGDHEQAFDACQRANACARRLHDWDCDRHSELVTRMTRVFDADFFAGSAVVEEAELPVLVVGMPRSGTTLAEQILASHSAAHGAGELNILAHLAGKLASNLDAGSWPECARALDRRRRAEAADFYRGRLRALAPDARRVIDKLPSNFMQLGLLATILPGTRVVHCTRDAADIAVSAFFQHFERGHAWSYDLYEIGRYHADYERLMGHWLAVAPLRFHEVSYEQVVDSQEPVSRALVAWSGLDWDPACLEFYRTRRVVRTASNVQVRQPLYRGSLQRARRYTHRLQDFERGLADGRSLSEADLGRDAS